MSILFTDSAIAIGNALKGALIVADMSSDMSAHEAFVTVWFDTCKSCGVDSLYIYEALRFVGGDCKEWDNAIDYIKVFAEISE